MKNKLFRVFFIIASVIMIILILAFIGTGVSEIRRVSDNRRARYNDESSYLYDLKSGNYGELYTMAVADTVRSGKYTNTENEIIALGMYFGTAVDRELCERSGNTEGAARDAALMEEYKSAAGEYGTYTDRIDESIGDLMPE